MSAFRKIGFASLLAIATAHAIEAHGLSRVAIIDFDAHHCNGTEAVFGGDDRVMICSSFQHPFYPFSGVEDAADNLVSIPLKAGADGAVFRREVTEKWLPLLDDFSPELVVVSAGFDGHVLDDMSALCLVEQDYRWISSAIRKLADKHAEGRILSVLEGGYDQGSLARSVVAHLRGLTE